MAPDKSPAFQFYPKDFLTDYAVLSMTNEQIGVYVQLLCHQWLMPDGLPATMAGLAKLAHCPTSRFETSVWPSIGVKFEQRESGHWFNRRLERVRAEQLAFRERKQTAGKMGGTAKATAKQNPSTATNLPEQKPSPSSSSSSSLDCAVGAGDWFWGEWRRVLGHRMSVPLQPKAAVIPMLFDIVTAVPDRADLVARLERFEALTDAERLKLGVKSLTPGFFLMALPDLGARRAVPVTCRHNHTPPCSDDIACTKRYMDDSQRVSA